MQKISVRTVLFEARSRLPIYFIAIFFVWPFLSTIMASISALSIPYYSVSLWQAMLLSLGGMTILLPDIMGVGIIGLLVSIVLFSLLASSGLIARASSRSDLSVEPIILFVAAVLGALLYFPSLLSHPVFAILSILPVWAITSILACIVVGWSVLLAYPGRRCYFVSVILVLASLAPLPVIYRNQLIPTVPATPPVVLLGIDSLSLSDDLSQIRHWTQANGGAWYARAVSPGLLTNSVWTSILLMKPVREHGVFYTFQSCPEVPSNSLVEEAKKQGYHTVSMFSDQLTCWVGSDYAFDSDLSGPIGWRQLATRIFEDSSVLLPILRPVLPRLPFSSVPPNHAGTYTYSIEREFNEILSQSSAKSATLVIAHSTYLHLPAYPKYLDMTWAECKRVLLSPALRVKDRTFDWQDVDRPDDAIPLRQWKLKRVQAALTEAMERMRFLERGGRMVLLSDHGDRLGISMENFHEERYHHVVFATFGLPVRDLNLPISTMDSGSILGLVEYEPFDPVVEFARPVSSEWPAWVHSAKLEWSGRVVLKEELLKVMFRRLRFHHPWAKMINKQRQPQKTKTTSID